MSQAISDWAFFADPEKGLQNRLCWLYIEVIKTAVQDAVKGIHAGIVDPVTLKPIYSPLMREEMAEWQNGAQFLRGESCADLCSHLNQWSDGILKLTPEHFVRAVKRSIKPNKTK
jgi:hypothetical protein